MSSLVFGYRSTTYLEPHAILRTYLHDSFIFHYVFLSSARFTFFFLSDRPVDNTITTNFWYVDVSTTEILRTQRLTTNMFSQIRSLHPSYHVNNHAQTGISLDIIAATSYHTRTKRLVFSKTLQAPRWVHSALPQICQHDAWSRHFLQSLNNHRVHPFHTNALRVISPASSSTKRRLQYSRYSRPSFTPGSE